VYEATVETPIRPTETAEKVRTAVLNVFPEAHLEEGQRLRGRAGSLDRFAALLGRQRIRDSSREVLLGSIRGQRLVFHLNKQAAFAGRISFSAHAPLGDIQVTVVSDDLRGLIQELAPATIRRGGGERRPTP
jgi:predicted RNA binding protein with dsRBD fold (UPF0201 family)